MSWICDPSAIEPTPNSTFVTSGSRGDPIAGAPGPAARRIRSPSSRRRRKRRYL